MGGGMGGGRPGGRGGGGMGGPRRSPTAMIKENLERNDPISFLLDKKKELALRDAQKDSLKSLHKEMQRMQSPLFKEMDKVFAELMESGARGGARGGGMGGGMGGGQRGGGMPPGGEGPDGGGRGMAAGMPDTARVLATRLSDIQDSFRDRARTQLDDGQRRTADSLYNVFLENERKKAEEQREKRRDRG